MRRTNRKHDRKTHLKNWLIFKLIFDHLDFPPLNNLSHWLRIFLPIHLWIAKLRSYRPLPRNGFLFGGKGI